MSELMVIAAATDRRWRCGFAARAADAVVPVMLLLLLLM